MNERQGESPAVSNAMKLVLVVLALLVVVATALPFLRVDQWWIRVLDFPRGQIAVVGILLLASISITGTRIAYTNPWFWGYWCLPWDIR